MAGASAQCAGCGRKGQPFSNAQLKKAAAAGRCVECVRTASSAAAAPGLRAGESQRDPAWEAMKAALLAAEATGNVEHDPELAHAVKAGKKMLYGGKTQFGYKIPGVSKDCAWCNSPAPVGGAKPFQICTGCRVARYCSHECQAAHWKAGRKQQCKSRQEILDPVMDDVVCMREAARVGDYKRLASLIDSAPGGRTVPWGDAAQGITKKTALSIAAACGHPRCVKLLLEVGPNINPGDRFGQTAIHCGAESGSVEVVRLLLNAGADPCAPDGQGQTPLHLAAEEGHACCARLLLEAGASPTERYRGATPLEWAEAKGHAECAAYLRAAKCKRDGPTRKEHRGCSDRVLTVQAEVKTSCEAGALARDHRDVNTRPCSVEPRSAARRHRGRRRSHHRRGHCSSVWLTITVPGPKQLIAALLLELICRVCLLMTRLERQR